MLPFVCTNGTHGGDAGLCEACHACMVLSDDHGASWRFGGYGQAGSRESQVVQVPSNTSSATLYVTERNFGATPGHRMYARSYDGGETLEDYGIDPALPSPVTAHWTGIVASVLSIPPSTLTMHVSGSIFPRDRPNAMAILYTGPSNPHVRSSLTARVSHDGGVTWPGSKVIVPGLSGYSDLASVPDNGVGIIFENGDSTFSDRISFATLPRDWLPL